MKASYKVMDIKKVLDVWEKNYPDRKTISFSELENLTIRLRKPLIYNIEEIISLLLVYITNNHTETIHLCKESDVCKILKVKKLAMHQWRTKSYIRYIQIAKTIRYDLTALLEDLNKIRDKTYHLTDFIL